MKNNKRILFITYIDLLKPIEKEYYINSGDTVYFMAGISYFYSKDIDAKFLSGQYIEKQLKNNKNWALENFDICITMEANIFSTCYNETLKKNAELIKQLGIPVFVLGAGCQSTSDYSFKFLNHIKDNAKLYLDTIHDSGGDITLRGEFSKEALSTLGYSNLFVSGCPSIYFSGRDTKLSNQKVSVNEFKPMLNSALIDNLSLKIYRDYPNSIYFDQDIYLESLYCPSEVTNFKKYSFPFKELYEQNRIDGDMNYYLWAKQIRERNFNFSYGERIHGNLIAIQNKVPAFVKVIDSRTRELAEYFNIPNSITYEFDENKENLYDLYLRVNYDNFNESFTQKFDKFKGFLDNHDIPNILGNGEEFKDYLSKLDYIDYRHDKSLLEKRKEIIKKLPGRNIIKEYIRRLKKLYK